MTQIEIIAEIKNKKEFERLKEVLIKNKFIFLFSKFPKSYIKVGKKKLRETLKNISEEISTNSKKGWGRSYGY